MPAKDASDLSYRRFDRDGQFTPQQVRQWTLAKQFKLLSNKISFVFKFKQKESQMPYKSIITAVILFVVGSILIIIAALLYTGHINVQVRLEKLISRAKIWHLTSSLAPNQVLRQNVARLNNRHSDLYSLFKPRENIILCLAPVRGLFFRWFDRGQLVRVDFFARFHPINDSLDKKPSKIVFSLHFGARTQPQ